MTDQRHLEQGKARQTAHNRTNEKAELIGMLPLRKQTESHTDIKETALAKRAERKSERERERYIANTIANKTAHKHKMTPAQSDP